MLKIAWIAPALFLLPLSGALPLSSAAAQVGGSYRGSCTNVRQDGSMLTADCRNTGGQRVTTTIDTARCGGQGVANNDGRLACGNVRGSAMPSRGAGGGYDGNDDGYQRQRPRRYDQPAYGAPPPRYSAPDRDDGYDSAPPRPRFRRPPPTDYDD